MLGTSCSPLARHTMPAAARRPDSFSAKTDPAVLLAGGFAMALRIVQTGRMRELSIAKTSVNHTALLAILSSRVTIAVALQSRQRAVLATSRCVRTAVTWTNPSAMASVTLSSHILRIRTVCRARKVPRSAYSVRQNAMETQTATTAPGLKRAGMSRIALSSPRLISSS